MLVRYVCAMVAASALLLDAPAVRAEAGAGTAASADSQSGSVQQSPGPPRLRFRSKGPTCMCLDGLSEAEIEAAERARKRSADELPAIIQNP